MRNQHSIAHKLKPKWSDIFEERRLPDHFVAYARECDNKARDRQLRINKRQELIHDSSVPDPVGTNLDDSVWRCFGSCCLNINHDEVQVFQSTTFEIGLQFYRRVVDESEATIVSHEI